MQASLRVILSVLCVSFLGSAGASAQVLPAEDHAVEMSLMFWKPTPELRLSTGALTGAGVDEVDFVQEFGLENKYFKEFRLTAGSRRSKFRTSYLTFNYDADTTIVRTIAFQGQTFNIGAPATADIKWKLWKFGFERDLVSRERGYFGIVTDIKYNRVEASIDSPVLASAATTDTTAWVPTFGVIGRGYLVPAVSITGEFTGLSLGLDDFEGDFWDFDLYGTVSFGRHLAVQGGYRSIVVDYLVDEDQGDLKMKGPYFGGVLRF